MSSGLQPCGTVSARLAKYWTGYSDEATQLKKMGVGLCPGLDVQVAKMARHTASQAKLTNNAQQLRRCGQ